MHFIVMFIVIFSVVWVQFSAVAEYFKGFFLALPTLPEPGWQKMSQSPFNGTTHNIFPPRRKPKIQPWTDNGSAVYSETQLPRIKNYTSELCAPLL